jgi:hypothetical protein
MARWTRPDGLVVDVDQNCTTENQLMAYLDEAECGTGCGAKFNRMTHAHCGQCHTTHNIGPAWPAHSCQADS